MAIFMVDVNGTSLGANVDIPSFAISNKARRVVAYALTGGNAASDTKVKIKYNGREIVEAQNTDTDDVPDNDELMYLNTNYVLGRYQPLELNVSDAAPSACYMCVIIKNLTRRRRGRR